MSSEPTPRDGTLRRPLRSLAFRVSAWYMGVFVASLGALVALAIPMLRAAFDRADTIVLDARVDRHLAVLATGLPRYQAAVEHSASLGDPEVPVRIRDATTGATIYEHGDVAAARLTTERTTGDLRLEIGAPSVPWPVVIGELRPRVVLLGLGALLLAVGGGYLLTRRGLRPVRELAATAREIVHSGDLSRRVPERGTTDELDEVSALFNRMLARNQALVSGMREALDNVAHDLRTPLTRLRGSAEVALGSDLAAAREALGVCIEESDHLLTMLRSLMDISEAESGLMKLDRTEVSLDKLASDVGELYDHVAEEAGVTFTVKHGDPALVLADPTRLRQAIANLVDNAIKYTPRGGTVTVEVDRNGSDATVRVRDTGEGISPDAIPRIWDRLFRAEPSRSKPGLGLGLSLVKAIVTAHGGTVTVESTPSHGSVFTLTLAGAPERG